MRRMGGASQPVVTAARTFFSAMCIAADVISWLWLNER